jgi:hypothetical protein
MHVAVLPSIRPHEAARHFQVGNLPEPCGGCIVKPKWRTWKARCCAERAESGDTPAYETAVRNDLFRSLRRPQSPLPGIAMELRSTYESINSGDGTEGWREYSFQHWKRSGDSSVS